MFERVTMSLKITPDASPCADTINPIPPPETGFIDWYPGNNGSKNKTIAWIRMITIENRNGTVFGRTMTITNSCGDSNQAAGWKPIN